ncbi:MULTISPECIES: hypothetical protein [unclassified Streptomyces]|uniref:hypothetical protein n=1 Tax=unclassified Streptomyces TaxID=2593676 RepID=UPI000F6BFB06|nr:MULTISPECIES: hypothetical protein [unclassified Streptomyces]AZM60160.1 hypothetical protein DLM49_11880 [Streptomyces sp. WAC 01438]RSM96419.1 hypothetical protein DMA10_13850 [Streptomyces sp. WAC 01420]
MTDLSERTPSGAADPVKALLHRHNDLCVRAVDPLEIAAGLEAHGITDRTAARFRHRDVFSLAEELYARTPRDDAETRPTPPTTSPRSTTTLLLPFLPGALCAATVLALHHSHGETRLYATAVGILAVVLALRAVLRRGPLSAPRRAHRPTTTTSTCWLIGYALLGDGLLRVAITGGPDGLPDGTGHGHWPLAAAPAVALAFACAPAAWTAGLFATHARRRLASSRGLEDFSASARPALLGAFTVFLGAVAALSVIVSTAFDEPLALPGTLALGALLFLARLLTVHHFMHAPKVMLGVASVAQATALASVFAARLPGLGVLSTPVESVTAVWGPAAVPVLTCGAAALILLIHAARTLTRASAHLTPEQLR